MNNYKQLKSVEAQLNLDVGKYNI